ncbi:MAG: two-component sensor histidine kinase [Deltaproteobacteria bacterium]|nr:MAG: two-component sensor histidine kinase [Deltaproteobacteria bacterium]
MFKHLKNPLLFWRRNPLLFWRRTPLTRYTVLNRNIIIIMLLITIIPLTCMLIINNFQYKTHLRNQIMAPLYAMTEKTRHSFEIFMDQRLAIMRFISATYSVEKLGNEQVIQKILTSLKKERYGFVDIGLINAKGDLVSYVGPYSLLGKNYSEQISFQETRIKGQYISNVFLGYRKYPHIVIAVQVIRDDGEIWVLRATIDTDFFDNLISSMGLERRSDAFLVNSDGILQTNSLYCGNTLEKCPLKLPSKSFKSQGIETKDANNQDIIIVSSGFSIADYILVIVQPQSVALKSWYALKTEMLIIFLISLTIIVFAIVQMTAVLIKRIKTSDEHRESVLLELQHAQKLSSIGRLAAGVAHEINNPLAIINEKAGLMLDLIDLSKDFTQKSKFGELTRSIVTSVDRCRKITHRLLGFSKRIDVKIEPIQVNTIIHEVIGFLEKDILYRRLEVNLKLSETLEPILSDHGQIQQVLLNLLTNAFAAVQDELGQVDVETKNIENNGIEIKITDNGCGIPDKIIKNIFDPFFTTKKEKGTGLGLSISYGIITKLGGEIVVDSTQGKGSVFTIVLPEKTNIMES